MKQDHKQLLIMLSIAILLLAIPFLLRGSSAFDMQSLYHTRLTHEVLAGNSLDTMTVLAGEHQFTLLHYLLALFFLLLGPTASTVIFPLLLAGISCILVFLVSRRFSLSPLLTTSLFIISPAFLAWFSQVHDQGLAVTMLLATLYFFFVKKWKILGLLASLALARLSLPLAVTTALLAFVLKDDRGLAFGVGTIGLVGMGFHARNDFLSTAIFQQKPLLERIFFDLGSYDGVSFLFLLIVFMGAYLFWQKEQGNTIPLLLFAGLLAGLALPSYNSVSFLVMIFFASLALQKIIEREWSLPLVKHALLTIIALSLLATLVSSVQLASVQSPSHELQEGLLWLKENTDTGAVVFTHYKYSFALQNIAQRKTILDARPERLQEAQKAYIDSLELLHSHELIPVKTIIDRYSIDYIIITREMEEGLVWKEKGRGLSFTSDNFENFKKAFESSELTIFEVKKSP